MTGVWATNDTISATRMNEKTTFQGTGAAISGLTTYAGMVAFCTSTGSGFTADTLYFRNAANSAWLTVASTSSQTWSVGRLAATDGFLHMNIYGATTNTSANGDRIRSYVKDAMTLKNLFVNVTASASAISTTFSLRRDDADMGTTVSVGAAATGTFEATQTTSLSADGNYHFIKNGDANSITFSIGAKVTI